MENLVEQQLERLRLRLKGVYAGDIPLLLVVSPYSLGISTLLGETAAEYDAREQIKWAATPHAERPTRRTFVDDEKATELYRPLTYFLLGRVSYPQFHCRMYWASYRHEVLVLDDTATLNNPEVVTAIQQATDLAHDRWVQYDYNVRNLPDDRVPARYRFTGGMVIVVKSDEAIPHVLRDRAVTLFFTSDLDANIQYILGQAFNRNNHHGLFHYLLDHGVSDVDEAISLVHQIEGFVWAELVPIWKQPEAKSRPSFRVLQRIALDRVNHPEEWEELARHLVA